MACCETPVVPFVYCVHVGSSGYESVGGLPRKGRAPLCDVLERDVQWRLALQVPDFEICAGCDEVGKRLADVPPLPSGGDDVQR